MCLRVGLKGWLRWSAHPFGGIEYKIRIETSRDVERIAQDITCTRLTTKHAKQ